jgi:hypothetical protein
MILICMVPVLMNMSGVYFKTEAFLRGKLIAKADGQYVVDFSKSVRNTPIIDTRSDFKKYKIRSNQCEEL